jgi:hypothetical protein
MSIRMLTLTSAEDGTKFRLAAHCISSYWRNKHYTRVNGPHGFDVIETPEQIDRYFWISDVQEEDAKWQPQEVDETEEADGITLNT